MEQKIRDMLSAIDQQDMAAFGTFLADDARFVFGNAFAGAERIPSGGSNPPAPTSERLRRFV